LLVHPLLPLGMNLLRPRAMFNRGRLPRLAGVI
jgi:hypothetical protein